MTDRSPLSLEAVREKHRVQWYGDDGLPAFHSGFVEGCPKCGTINNEPCEVWLQAERAEALRVLAGEASEMFVALWEDKELSATEEFIDDFMARLAALSEWS